MKRFLIIDEHALFRFSLSMIVKELVADCEVIEVDSLGAGLTLLKDEHFDITTLDIQMHQYQGGVKLGEILSHISKKTNVVVVTAAREEEYVKRCFHAGVKGFVKKSATYEEVSSAISNVLRERYYVSENVHALLLRDPSFRVVGEPRLSEREREVMDLMSQGMLTKEIAEILQIRSNTVSTYKSKILNKMSVENTVDLARKMNGF